MSISKELSDEIALYNLSKEEKVDYETLLQVLQFAFTKLNSFKCTLDQLYEYLPEDIREIKPSEYPHLIRYKSEAYLKIEKCKKYLFTLTGFYDNQILDGWLELSFKDDYFLLENALKNYRDLSLNLSALCAYINNEYSPNVKVNYDKLLETLEPIEEVILIFKNKIWAYLDYLD